MSENLIITICQYLASFLAVTLILTLHEFSHAFAAVKCGDNTPKFYGRLSLNPLRHFDIAGLIMFTLVGFGWAKPVPVNPGNYRNIRKGSIIVSLAGVLMNLALAFLCYPLHLLVLRNLEVSNALFLTLYYFTYFLFAYNLSFCVFNLLPFFPLDGFRFFEAVSNGNNKVYEFLRKYGQQILFGLIIESFICERIPILSVFNILGYVMTFATNIVGFPITSFWNFIFGLIG